MLGSRSSLAGSRRLRATNPGKAGRPAGWLAGRLVAQVEAPTDAVANVWERLVDRSSSKDLNASSLHRYRPRILDTDKPLRYYVALLFLQVRTVRDQVVDMAPGNNHEASVFRVGVVHREPDRHKISLVGLRQRYAFILVPSRLSDNGGWLSGTYLSGGLMRTCWIGFE